jgi:hypothetical protein
MAHRMEVELTSKSEDGTWTWRAAGAKQPRGTVGADLVPPDAVVGAVLRAEVESSLDGTVVTALMAPKSRTLGRAGGSQRIEITGSPRRDGDVNVVLTSRSRRRRDGGDGEDGRGPRDGERGARRPRREPRDGEGRRTEDGGRTRRGPARPGGDERGGRRRGAETPGGRDTRRPAASTTYRNAALASLKPEELPVAEQLLRGGIPGVRQAIEDQNTRARADGRPEVTPAPLLAMAERLLPVVNLATWKDRASTARNAGREVSLRELRAIVAAASTVNLDDEGRQMADELRQSLDQRVTALRDGWVRRITGALDAGRVLDAVRASVRPPEPAARLSGDLAVRLSTAAGEAMASDTSPDDWLALLQVVIDSPVRRTVKPAGLPSGADEALLAEARRAAGYVPELARLLGIPIPPPPGPRRPVPARAGPQRRAS